MKLKESINRCTGHHDITEIVKNGVKPLPHNDNVRRPEVKSLLKPLWDKGENAGDQHFLLFPQCFLLYLNRRNCSM